MEKINVNVCGVFNSNVALTEEDITNAIVDALQDFTVKVIEEGTDGSRKTSTYPVFRQFNVNVEHKDSSVYLLKVYDERGCLLPNVMPFRSEAGAKAAAAEWVPAGRTWEVVVAEVSD